MTLSRWAILVPYTHGKIALPNRSTSEFGSCGSGDANVYEPNKCLISDQCGSVDVSSVSSNELRHLTRYTSNIQAHLSSVRESTVSNYKSVEDFKRNI